MALGGVTIVVDERDDLFSTQAALQAHRPEDGRITVQPTPASGSPAALAHDVLYALGKRLAPGPNSPDVWLDSVNAAWLAAAAWGVATGVRHVVVTRTHLLTPRRLDQLLAWREMTGVQLTLLWQKALHRLPPALARVEHLIIGCAQLETALAEPGPAPARPYFPPGPAGMAAAEAAPQQSPPTQPLQAHAAPKVPRPAHACMGAAATAQLAQPTPAGETTPESAEALAGLAHPLIAGALSALAFTRNSLDDLRWTRDLDITGDITALKTHTPGHRRCHLHTVPAWARPLLASARAHHRLAHHPPEDSMFTPVMVAEARHIRAHAERLHRNG